MKRLACDGGSRYLKFRGRLRTNNCQRVIIPEVVMGPFGTWLAFWAWGELEYGLMRWI